MYALSLTSMTAALAMTAIASAMAMPETNDLVKRGNPTCKDPSGDGKGGSRPIGKGDIDSWLRQLDSDHSKYCAPANPDASIKQGWILVGNVCGGNNAAVWLQTYDNKEFCMTGHEAAKNARKVVDGCLKDGQLYGYYQLSTGKKWVEVAKSTSGCKVTGGVKE